MSLLITFFHAFGLFDVAATSLEDAVHFWLESNILSDGSPGARVLHLVDDLLVVHAVQWVLLWELRCVVEVLVLGNVGVDILRFDFEEQAIRVGVDQFAVLSVPGFQVVVVKVVHQFL